MEIAEENIFKSFSNSIYTFKIFRFQTQYVIKKIPVNRAGEFASVK